MDMATDADINIEHRLTEVEQRAKSNTNRLNEHDEILKSNSDKFKWLIVTGLVTLILGYLAVSVGLK